MKKNPETVVYADRRLQELLDTAASNLNENEHVLRSPDLVGTDEEKISAISYWSNAVGLLRTLNLTAVSYQNKLNLITAMRAELEIIEKEIENVTTQVKADDEQIPSMQQDPEAATTDAATPEVDLGKSVTDTEPVDLPKIEPKSVTMTVEAKQEYARQLERIQRAAGTFYLSKKTSVLDTHKK